MAADLPVLSFASSAAWEAWLKKHHADAPGVWLCIGKKGAGKRSVTYAEALDAALCYGWIDGQKQKGDDASWLQKFTPRRAKSGWSKVNTLHAERLIAAGRMQPAGLRRIAAAKADGRWARAYDPSRSSAVPEDFLRELAKHTKAKAFFETLNKANLYAIAYRLQTAKKPKTRERRLRAIVEMMKAGKKFH